MPERSKITARENGALVVKNAQSMQTEAGEALEVKPAMALCRCGHSANKPYCDGSHKRVGFQSSGGEPAGSDRVIHYEGLNATVTYNPRLCSHASECVRIAVHIFNPAARPWVQPDNGRLAELEEVVAACPSGALAFEGPDHRLMDRPTITVQDDGPYWVQYADIDASEPGLDSCEDKFVLCRCGMSGNKPYCDGTHSDKGWKSD